MKYCPVCETDYPDDVTVCPQDGASVRRPGERPDPFLGRVIKGRYRVERLLGRGGMGTVYLAEQLSVGRKVALKVLRGDFARDDGFVARFRQEAKLVAGLNEKRNPRVTLVHDFDQADDGSVFIVMEWLEGRLLSTVIQAEGPLPLPRAVRLAAQIAEGLEAAHRAGVIHRDIKPQNIMVLEPGDDIKLMDFGIARLRDSGRTNLTRAGTMMGTPDYMAPEQIEGQEVTDRTDIYSFGIVFYEMLVGSLPFRASTQAAVLTKQLQERPVPPSRLRPDIPQGVEAVILRALEKDPAKREGSMGEIVRLLRLADVGGAEPPVGGPTIVVNSVNERPGQTAAVTIQEAPGSTLVESGFTAARTQLSREPAADMTLVGAETPGGADPRFRRRRPALPWKGILVGGGAAAVLAAAVATTVYLVRVPPPTPVPHLAGPAPVVQSSTPVSPSPSVIPPSPMEIVPPKPPEPVAPPAVIAAPKPAPPSAVTPAVPTAKAHAQSRPASPAPKSRIETSPPSVASKLASSPPSPERLRAQVEDRLRSRGLLRGSGSDPDTGVSVEVSPTGVVTLHGIVRDAAQREEAARLARLAGVSEVRLRVNVQSSWN
jgi:serine/threonine-protein kinase